MMAQITIIGGGLSGLINAILLGRAGFDVLLFEKNKYPFHRVCGEYISKEVIPFLKQNDLYPDHFKPSEISQLEITSLSGDILEQPLNLGGFGLSRYVFDLFLADKAREAGVNLMENSTVKEVRKDEGSAFKVITGSETTLADLVIGAQGKRSPLDKQLDRDFLKRRSPYVGVKYHIRGSLRPDTISLHNFNGGYCGVNQIEDDKYNLCYLVHREQVRKHGSIEKCEEEVLSKNQYLKSIWDSSEFLFDEPVVVNEVAFSSKGLSKEGVLFSGDAAGTIAPFSGNGMAMAIRSAKYLSEAIIQTWPKYGPDHARIYQKYSRLWNAEFASRISRGRKIQSLFGSPWISNFSVKAGNRLPFIINPILKMTHGQPFS